MDDLMLPPLPEPAYYRNELTISEAYTADQMREYARKAVEAEREACIEACANAVTNDWEGIFDCIDAIRARASDKTSHEPWTRPKP